MSLSDVNESVTVHVHERNGSILTINSRPVLFREFVKTYFKMTGLYFAHVFRIIHDGRLIPLDLDVMMPSGSNHINIYVFHAPPSRYPDFFGDIVPRLLDMKYGPDIAVLINTCTIARTCPYKSNGYLNWQHDITYRASKDSKWKVGSETYCSKKDNWLHYRHLASVALKKTKKIAFFKEHRVPSLFCDHSPFFEKNETDPLKLKVCTCAETFFCEDCMSQREDMLTCEFCHSALCENCDRSYCDDNKSPDCLGVLCDKCRNKRMSSPLVCECHTYFCPPCLKFNDINFFKCIYCRECKCMAHKEIECSLCNEGLCSECVSQCNDVFSECHCHGELCKKCLTKKGAFSCIRCHKISCFGGYLGERLQCSVSDCDEAMCEDCVESGFDINSLASEGWTVSDTTGEPLCNAHREESRSDYSDEFVKEKECKICD